MTRLLLLVRVLRTLWRTGLLRIAPTQLPGVVRAWWRCGNTYAALAAIAAVRFGSRCAIHDDTGTLTFSALDREATSLALALRQEHGLGPGQQAALLSRNHRGFVVGLVALTRLGVDVLVLGCDSPALALGRIFERQRVDLILHDGDLTGLLTDAAPTVVRRAIERSSNVRAVVPLPRVSRAGQLVVLTSGSSGVPKGVRRRPTLTTLLPTLWGLLDGLPIQLHRPAVLAIPLHHGYGLATLAMTLAMGAPLHTARRFEVAPLLQRLDPEAEAVLVSIPTLLRRWLNTEPHPGPRLLSAIVTGSAPLDARLCTQLLDVAGPLLFNLCGSTEAGVMAMALPAALRAAPGSVGQPLPGTTVQLLDPAGQPVARGALGRITVRGPLVLRAHASGWLDTGDLGRLDAEGRLFVCGRADAMFVSGGENVYPAETEAALAAHPDLVDAAVSVVPDSEFGQRMIAWFVPRGGADVDDAVLRAWLRERLERYQLPRSFERVSQIPRNALGKVDRRALEALAPRELRAR